MGTTISLRRLSERTLALYVQIIEHGGQLTLRQQRALLGHILITDDRVVTALLRPDIDWMPREDDPEGKKEAFGPFGAPE